MGEGSVGGSYVNSEDNSLALKKIHIAEPISAVHAPLASSYNVRIRPLLDAVDKLRSLDVMQEGIQLPTIVVVGDQSSGKSSVLESLAGITLPRGQGICTRVPLIMRLQHHPDSKPQLHLEYHDKKVASDEAHIAEAISQATDVIAGSDKGISRTPLTLVLKKNGVPDLTMVDLPGITRVPVRDQPEDIYEQIAGIIMEYIKPEESIILNVLSATVDFPTCESIRMSQVVDKNGERTLAVVTKSDQAPQGLLEKVTADDVSIGLGYVCVRNRIGDESFEDARMEEAKLFETHPLLSKINKSMVGIPVLAEKLVQIQATIVAKCLPEIARQINDKLSISMSELKWMPQSLSSEVEAMIVFMRILGSSKDSLKKILLSGEFDEYPNDKSMHCTARLAEMLNQCCEQLRESAEENSTENFLMEEINVLQEARGISLPNFLPRTAFLTLVQKKVNSISGTPSKFIAEVWDYIENVVIKILMYHSENYPQFQSFIRKAAHGLMSKVKEKSAERVMEIIDTEKMTVYTCDPDYMSTWSKLMTYQSAFNSTFDYYGSPKIKVYYSEPNIQIEGFGEINVKHLRDYPEIRDQAFDMKMRLTAYWKCVLKRLVDFMALHLQLTVQNLVNKDMEAEIVNELMICQSGGVEWMLDESPAIAKKRERLNKRVELLKDSKEVMAKIMFMDKITIDVGY